MTKPSGPSNRVTQGRPLFIAGRRYKKWQGCVELTVLIRQKIANDLLRPILDVADSKSFLDCVLATVKRRGSAWLLFLISHLIVLMNAGETPCS